MHDASLPVAHEPRREPVSLLLDRDTGIDDALALIYLCSVDTLAIHVGIWTIDPHQSLGVLLAGQLPLEEVIFFSLTSTLVAFGLVLGVAAASRERLHARLTLLARRFRFSAPRDTAVKSDSITTQP